MQRAGHVVLDGVADPDAWISYKVSVNATWGRSLLTHRTRYYGCRSLGDEARRDSMRLNPQMNERTILVPRRDSMRLNYDGDQSRYREEN